MMRTFTATALVALLAAAPAIAETRTFDMDAFDGIEVSSGLDLTFEAGAEQSVTVDHSGDDWDRFEIDVIGGVLELGRRSNGIMNWGRRPGFMVTVTAPNIQTLKVSSGADAEGIGMSGERVIISVSSGSDATVTDIQAESVELSSSSGADLTASGTCESLEASSSSGSDIEADDLICRFVEADASSGSDIEVHATESLVAEASSGADIEVSGSPVSVSVDKSSGGSVDVDRVN